jgi:hypothetical protein
MEEDLRTQAAPPLTFTNPDKMVEMIRRGNGRRDLDFKQAVEHAIMAGRGNVDLLLRPEQYQRLGGIKMVDSAINGLFVGECFSDCMNSGRSCLTRLCTDMGRQVWATALEKWLSPGPPRAYLQRLLSRQKLLAL